MKESALTAALEYAQQNFTLTPLQLSQFKTDLLNASENLRLGWQDAGKPDLGPIVMTCHEVLKDGDKESYFYLEILIDPSKKDEMYLDKMNELTLNEYLDEMNTMKARMESEPGWHKHHSR
jgi:hypothetical protein